MTILSLAVMTFLTGFLFGAGITLAALPRDRPVQDTREGNEGSHMSEYHVCMWRDHGHHGIDRLRGTSGSPSQDQLPTEGRPQHLMPIANAPHAFLQPEGTKPA